MINPRIRNTLPDVEAFLDHCDRHNFKARSVLVRAGDPSESFFFVLDGTLSISIKDEEEQDLILNYANAGDFFGEVGLFKEEVKDRYASVQAKTDCEVAEIRYDRFRDIMNDFPHILIAIGSQMADRLTDASRRLHDMAFVDARGRISNALLELCEQPAAMTHPDGMQIKVSRQELARIAGCSREVAGRMLKQLENDGLVEVSGHTIVVRGTR